MIPRVSDMGRLLLMLSGIVVCIAFLSKKTESRVGLLTAVGIANLTFFAVELYTESDRVRRGRVRDVGESHDPTNAATAALEDRPTREVEYISEADYIRDKQKSSKTRRHHLPSGDREKFAKFLLRENDELVAKAERYYQL